MRILLLLVVGFVIYKIFELVFSKVWNKGLTVSLRCEKEFLYEGEKLELYEVIKNEKILPLPAAKTKFSVDRSWEDGGKKDSGHVTDQYYRNDVFSVGSYEKIQRRLTFTCTKRGYYVLGNVDVFVSDFFYNKEYVFRVKNEQWVYVFPRMCRNAEINLISRKMFGEIDARKNLYEDPFSFAGIRDYQSYDSMNKVNWKASAKTGGLKVNKLESATDFSVLLVLYFQEHNGMWESDKEEYAIRIAATLAGELVKKGISCSLVTNGQDVESEEQIVVQAGAGARHMESVNRALARIHLDKGGIKMELEAISEAKEDYVVVISDCQMEHFVKKLMEESKKKREFLWILPYKQEEEAPIVRGLEGRICTIAMEAD